MVYARYAVKMHSRWRNVGSRFANWMADRLLDKPRGLYLSSFRCMSALIVREVTRYSGPYPYVDGLVMQTTQHIDSVEVKHLARADGRSSYTLPRLLRLWLNLTTNFSVLPLRLAVVAGALMGVLGVIASVFVIAEGFLGRPPSGWTSIMAVMLLVSSVQFVILGVLGEYVGRAFLTSNGKPQGVIRDVVTASEIACGRGAAAAQPVGGERRSWRRAAPAARATRRGRCTRRRDAA